MRNSTVLFLICKLFSISCKFTEFSKYTLEDIIHHYPYRYDIIEETYPNESNDSIIIEAKVISPVKIFFKGKDKKEVKYDMLTEEEMESGIYEP